MSHELVVCLIAVAANLAGMLVIYALLSHALASFAWKRGGAFGVILLVAIAQLFWIAPARWIVEAQGTSHAASYALWFGNWVVTGFYLLLCWKSVARTPRALDDAAQSDGLAGLARWRHVVLPFVGRDLVVVALFTVMATLLPFWGVINQPDANNVVTLFERGPGFAAHLGAMAAASLIGAVPLLAIFFGARKTPPAI
jgi:ABC-type glycerol-3-phosphate transport system permease component